MAFLAEYRAQLLHVLLYLPAPERSPALATGETAHIEEVECRTMGAKACVWEIFYISSLPSDARRILQVVRNHWASENELHWVRDVALQEDHSRVRKDQAPENLAVLRHIALNLLKQEKTAKGGIHAKQLQAAWNQDCLRKVLAAAN